MNRPTRILGTLWVGFFLLSVSTAMAGTVKGTVKMKRARSAKDVIVYIEKVEGEFPPPGEPAVMDQKNLEFIPHVLPIVKGTTVDFLNSDSVAHNAFSPDQCAEKMNLGTWPQGEIRSYTYQNEGCEAVMLCNVHAEMEAWIVVFQNPYFYKTGKDGSFTIENVPAGTYTLRVWHKRAAAPPREITVPQEGEVVVDFKLKRKRKR